MSFIMPFTDKFGTAYPQSYWRPAHWGIDKDNKHVAIRFDGYMDSDHKGQYVIGTKTYQAKNGDFDTYFSPAAIDPEGEDYAKNAYAFALALLDVDSGQRNEDGSVIAKSFFDGAKIG